MHSNILQDFACVLIGTAINATVDEESAVGESNPFKGGAEAQFSVVTSCQQLLLTPPAILPPHSYAKCIKMCLLFMRPLQR